MHFSSRHLHALSLAIFATSSLLQQPVGANLCPDHSRGRLATEDCKGYVDCINGVEIDSASCDEGTLYSSSTENCEDEDLVSCMNSLNGDVAFALATDTPSTVTKTPMIADDGDMWIEDTRTSSSNTPISHDGPDTSAVSTTAVNIETESPLLIDDKDTWIQDETETASTEQLVNDGLDAVAPWSTPAPPVDIAETTTPAVASDGPDATAIWSTTELPSTPSAIDQFYTPNRSQNICTPVDQNVVNGKTRKRFLRSVWDALYPTKDDCCAVFLFNEKHYDSCVNN